MWEAVTALAAVAGIGVGAWTIVADGMRTRRALQIDLLTRLVDRFESPAFEQTRTQAARYLLHEEIDPEEGARSLDAVLNFFETIAFYQRRGAVDYDALWHTFSVWLIPYCILANGYLAQLRARDPTSYEDLLRLQAELERIDQLRGGLFAPSEAGRVERAKHHIEYEAHLRLPAG